MADQLKTERVQLVMTPDETKAIDDWRFAHRIDSRSEAMRLLIKKGLDAPED